MDNSTFRKRLLFINKFLDLRYAPDQKLNIRLIENTDIKNVLRVTIFEFFIYQLGKCSRLTCCNE
jgi:hypothetical protein